MPEPRTALTRMSNAKRKKEPQWRLNKPRYYFFLNPYPEMAFTRCPKCEQKTRVRKHCLLIHIDPKTRFSLNKSCRFCPWCDLIIVKQTELESLLVAVCEQYTPDIIGNDYFVFGTMDRKDWKQAQTGKLGQQEAIKQTYPFRDHWNFKVQPAGWYPKEDRERRV